MIVIEIIEKLKMVKDKSKEIYICTPSNDNDKHHYEKVSCIGVSEDGIELFSSELFPEDEEII